MTRPAVIIGVGGTGQWVLTYLKRDLLEEGNGKLPKNVRFLAFDTMPQSEVTLGSTSSDKKKKEDSINVGSVHLEPHEYVHVGGDAHQLGQEIFDDRQNKEFPHIRRWFQTNFWWKALPAASWILDEGAGRIRQLGRLAVFKDVMQGNAGSLIWRSLSTAISEVSGEVSTDRRLEVILVGSFAGGTGSGMFLDIALILRKLTAHQNPTPVVRGYFALPSVFGARQNDEMFARTFAAWRELNRFMVVDIDFPTRVDYQANNPSFQVNHNKHLFDACYLVGGYSGGQAIGADAKTSVFPALAESISAILDEDAGTTYTRYILANLAPEYAKHAGKPLYSTVGSYTMKIPAYYKQRMASHNFSLDILKALLQPRDWAAKGGDRLLSLAASNHNPEKGIGKAGRDEANIFLKSDEISFTPPSGQREIARPTLFTAKIQRISDVGGANELQLIDDHATAALRERRRDVEDPSWLTQFMDLGDDPAFGQLRQKVNDQLDISLIKIYGSRPDEKSREAARRILGNDRDINTFVFENYGGDAGDKEVFGKFGELLQECADFQLQLFRRMVRLWTLDTLMGRSDDALKARTGKLGYAYDFFGGVIDNLEKTRLFMEKVAQKRQQEKPRLTAEGMSENAKKMLEQNKEKKFLWFFDHPDVKKSFQHYLVSLQRMTDLRKEDVLHYYVLQTIEEMKNICLKAREELTKWIWHLATGDDPSKMPGLYSNIKSSQDIVTSDHKIDEDIAKMAFQKLIAIEPEKSDEAELKRVLACWHWQGDFNGNQLQLNVKFKPEGQPEGALNAVWREVGKRQEVAAEQNRQTFLEVTQAYFTGSFHRTEIAKELASGAEYPTAKDLSHDLQGKAQPMFKGRPGKTPARQSNIIRIGYKDKGTEVETYFKSRNGLEGQLRSTEKLSTDKPDDNYMITVENSSNPYKLTMVRTDDLYSHESFTEWDECKKAYSTFLFKAEGHNDPRLLHNFAPEINASHYEKRMGRDGRFEPLDAKVVMLLEEPSKFELALDCLLTGVIRLDRETQTWRLKRGKGQEIWLTELPTEAGTSESQTPDMFHALYTFLVKKEDIREDYQFIIDYKDIQELVEAEKQRRGWRDKMEDVLNLHISQPNGMVQSLQNSTKDKNGNLIKPEFADLARLVKLIFEDRKNNLTTQQGDSDTGLPWEVVDFNAPKTSLTKKVELDNDDELSWSQP